MLAEVLLEHPQVGVRRQRLVDVLTKHVLRHLRNCVCIMIARARVSLCA